MPEREMNYCGNALSGTWAESEFNTKLRLKSLKQMTRLASVHKHFTLRTYTEKHLNHWTQTVTCIRFQKY